MAAAHEDETCNTVIGAPISALDAELLSPAKRKAALRRSARRHNASRFAALLEAHRAAVFENPRDLCELLTSTAAWGFTEGFESLLELQVQAVQAQLKQQESAVPLYAWRWVLRALRLGLTGALQNAHTHLLPRIAQHMRTVWEQCPSARLARMPLLGPMRTAARQGGDVARRLLTWVGEGGTGDIAATLEGVVRHARYRNTLWQHAWAAAQHGFGRLLLRDTEASGDVHAVAGLFEHTVQKHTRFVGRSSTEQQRVAAFENVFRERAWLSNVLRRGSHSDACLAFAWIADAATCTLPRNGSFDVSRWEFSAAVRDRARVFGGGSRAEVAQAVVLLGEAGLGLEELCVLVKSSCTMPWHAQAPDSLPVLCRVLQGWLDAHPRDVETVMCCKTLQCRQQKMCLVGNVAALLQQLASHAIQHGSPAVLREVLLLQPLVPLRGLETAVCTAQITADQFYQHKLQRQQHQVMVAALFAVKTSLRCPHCCSLALNSAHEIMVQQLPALQKAREELATKIKFMPHSVTAEVRAVVGAQESLALRLLQLSCLQRGVRATWKDLGDAAVGLRVLWADVMWGRRRGLVLHRAMRRSAVASS